MINLFCIKKLYEQYEFYINSLNKYNLFNLIFIENNDELLAYIMDNNMIHDINILISQISESLLKKMSFIKKYNNNINLINTSIFNSNEDNSYINNYNITIINYGYKETIKYRNIFNIPYPLDNCDIISNEKINDICVINKINDFENKFNIYKNIDINDTDWFNVITSYKILLYLQDDKHSLYDEYILQKCILNRIVIISNFNFSNYSELLSKYVININYDNIPNFMKFINTNYDYIYNMVYKDFNDNKIITDIIKYNNNFFNNTLKINNYGFIIIRHVNSEKTNKYWIESYKSIRKYYNNKIVIIDDNSNYDYIKCDENEFYNCEFVQSEFNCRGEILGYYYLYNYKLFEKAVIIHDSVFINSYINFNQFNNIRFIWYFLHHWDNNIEELDLLDKIENNELLKDVYNDKSKWVGCFGLQSVIDYKFLENIVVKYNLFSLLDYIKNRSSRMNVERIFAVLCFAEYSELINKPSLFGIIHHYIHWGYTYESYVNDKLHGNIAKYPIIKVWTGR
jgi:hypothetical protein